MMTNYFNTYALPNSIGGQPYVYFSPNGTPVICGDWSHQMMQFTMQFTELHKTLVILHKALLEHKSVISHQVRIIENQRHEIDQKIDALNHLRRFLYAKTKNLDDAQRQLRLCKEELQKQAEGEEKEGLEDGHDPLSVMVQFRGPWNDPSFPPLSRSSQENPGSED